MHAMGRWSAAAAAAEHDGDDAARGDWRRRAAEHRDTAAMNSDRQQLSLPLSWISLSTYHRGGDRSGALRWTGAPCSRRQQVGATGWGQNVESGLLRLLLQIATIQRYNYHSYYRISHHLVRHRRPHVPLPTHTLILLSVAQKLCQKPKHSTPSQLPPLRLLPTTKTLFHNPAKSTASPLPNSLAASLLSTRASPSALPAADARQRQPQLPRLPHEHAGCSSGQPLWQQRRSRLPPPREIADVKPSEEGVEQAAQHVLVVVAAAAAAITRAICCS